MNIFFHRGFRKDKRPFYNKLKIYILKKKKGNTGYYDVLPFFPNTIRTIRFVLQRVCV